MKCYYNDILKIRLSRWPIAFILIFINSHVFPQEKFSINYNSSHGLSCNKIYVIRQDSKGFIWISTDNGLYQYDGLIFKRFSSINGLPSNETIEFDFGYNDDVWVSCFNKNLALIRGNKVLVANNYQPLRLFDKLSVVPSIYSFQSPRLIIKTNGGISYYSIYKGDSITKVLPTEISTTNKNLTLCYNHHTSELYFSDNKNTKIVIRKTLEIPKISTFSDDKFLVRASPTYSLIISKLKGKIDSKVLDTTINFRQVDYARNSNKIWGIKNKRTLICFDQNLNKIDSIHLPKIDINCILEDHFGGVWVGTFGSALYYIPNKSVYTYDMTNTIGNNYIVNTFQNGDTLYLLFSNGAIQRLAKNNPIPTTFYKGEPLNGEVFYTTFAIIGSKVFISDSRAKLYEKDPRINKSYIRSSKYGGKMYKADGHSTLHIASGPAFYIYNTNNGNSIKLPVPSYCSHRINKDSILTGGVNRISYIRLPQINTIDSNSISIVSDTLNHTMIVDINSIGNTMYLATNEWGVLIKNGKRYDTLNIKKGLNDNNCISLAKDQYSRMWVATYQGVYCIIKNKTGDYSVKPLSLTNSLFSANITKINCLGDYIYISTSKGLLQSPITSPNHKSETMPIWISGITNFGKVISPLDTLVRLNPDSNNLIITLSAIHFSSLGAKKYYYKIPGVVNQFTAINANNLTLDRLPHGSHTLMVKAISADGLETLEEKLLKIQVLPYWYQHWGGKLLITALSLLGILFLAQLVKQHQQKKRKKEVELNNQLVELELKAIKAQINPHFIFNTLNLIQYFIQNGKNEEADDYLSKMSKLIRTTLNYSNEVSIALIDEIDYLTTYITLESLRFDNTFKFTVEKNFPNEIGKNLIPTMVLQPHIENAIRHGLKPKINKEKNLKLNFHVNETSLICTVYDNGIGRKKSKSLKDHNLSLQTSHGDYLSHSKIALFKRITGKEASLTIEDLYENTEATGTLVTLKVEL